MPVWCGAISVFIIAIIGGWILRALTQKLRELYIVINQGVMGASHSLCFIKRIIAKHGNNKHKIIIDLQCPILFGSRYSMSV